MKLSSKSLKDKNLKLNEWLKETRIKQRKTQNEVAQKLNITPQFISNIELSKCEPPLEILKQLMIIYKIRPEDLIMIILSDKKRKLEQLFRL